MSPLPPVLLPVLLAGSAVAVLTAVPRPGAARLARLRAGPAGGRAMAPWQLAPGLAGLLGWLTAGPVAAALAVGGVLLLRRALAARARADRRRDERTRALTALALLAAELRSGRTQADALAAASQVASGPFGAALIAAAAAARLGGDVPAAVVADGSAVPEVLRALAACWQVCSAAGSGLAAGLERLEEGLRAAETQRRSVDAELAGPRATAGLLAVLPLGGIGLAAALGARPVHVLLHTPLGLACLLGGLLLDGAGVLWTRRLVTRAVPP